MPPFLYFVLQMNVVFCFMTEILSSTVVGCLDYNRLFVNKIEKENFHHSGELKHTRAVGRVSFSTQSATT